MTINKRELKGQIKILNTSNGCICRAPLLCGVWFIISLNTSTALFLDVTERLRLRSQAVHTNARLGFPGVWLHPQPFSLLSVERPSAGCPFKSSARCEQSCKHCFYGHLKAAVLLLISNFIAFWLQNSVLWYWSIMKYTSVNSETWQLSPSGSRSLPSKVSPLCGRHKWKPLLHSRPLAIGDTANSKLKHSYTCSPKAIHLTCVAITFDNATSFSGNCRSS